MARVERTRFAATIALLRGLVLFIAGVAALMWPTTALTVIVIIGGCLIIVDGVLSLASQDYGASNTWPFWLGLVRGIISVLVGILVLLSPYIVPAITLNTLATVCGIGAILVGLLEAVIIIRNRRQHSVFWAALLAAGLYVVLGLVLLFLPMEGALLVVQLAAVALIALGLLRMVQAWLEFRSAPGTRSYA